MRIDAHYPDLAQAGTYAVIANPIAGGLAGRKAIRYRLIRSDNPHWVRQANTLRSVSKTPGITILKCFDVQQGYEDTKWAQKSIEELHTLARRLSGHEAAGHIQPRNNYGH